MMLTVVWNPQRFHMINVLPKDSKFNAGHYISRVLSPLPEVFAAYQDDPKRHVVIRADNARLHCAKTVPMFLDHNSLRRAPHPLDSPDLTLSGFWLFRNLKGVLQEGSFDECDELLSAIQDIFIGVDRETLDGVFQEWMIRLAKIY
jgi:hypothetical protein